MPCCRVFLHVLLPTFVMCTYVILSSFSLFKSPVPHQWKGCELRDGHSQVFVCVHLDSQVTFWSQKAGGHPCTVSNKAATVHADIMADHCDVPALLVNVDSYVPL